jgi:hypothetical protein
MAELRFQILGNNNGSPSVASLGGSGLAFYGATPGSSVAIGDYQGTTYVANADGSVFTEASSNVKFQTTSTWPSGQCVLDAGPGSPSSVGLSGVRTMYGSLGIEFNHSSAVTVKNCQLRIYDRNNVSYPASGVNTKVAEIVNWNGSNPNSQGSDNGLSADVQGSGDLWWWGEAWPAEYCSKNYYTNSLGVVFYNGLDSASRTNGDSRLASAGVAGSYDTVGGTGIIVPLLDSPGSGQKGLRNSEVVSGSGMVWPKWTQYVTDSSNQTEIFGSQHSFGDGSNTTKTLGLANIDKTYGGTGVDLQHTWSVALSASPLSTGTKENYGLYVSLEYF